MEPSAEPSTRLLAPLPLALAAALTEPPSPLVALVSTTKTPTSLVDPLASPSPETVLMDNSPALSTKLPALSLFALASDPWVRIFPLATRSPTTLQATLLVDRNVSPKAELASTDN